MLLTAAFMGAVAAGCNNGSTEPTTTHDVLGPATAVGNGTARTFVVMQGSKPVTLGIQVSDDALANLPASVTEWQLPLPSGVSVEPFDHATLDWNPQGHPPPGIYMVPHFDFHFYMVSEAEQHAVQGGPDTVSIAASYIPPDYVPDPVAVPDMGVHWTDSQAPEFHGQPFERTFIYGSYHGRFTFLEPMVTLAYLQSQPAYTADVKQPQDVQQSGWYPTKYSVVHSAAGYSRIALDSLTQR